MARCRVCGVAASSHREHEARDLSAVVVVHVVAVGFEDPEVVGVVVVGQEVDVMYDFASAQRAAQKTLGDQVMFSPSASVHPSPDIAALVHPSAALPRGVRRAGSARNRRQRTRSDQVASLAASMLARARLATVHASLRAPVGIEPVSTPVPAWPTEARPVENVERR
jgi:hypothetical protein